MMIVEWSETKLSLSMDNYSLDAPYGDSFMVKEEWLVLSQQPYDRCVLRYEKTKINLVGYQCKSIGSKVLYLRAKSHLRLK